MGLALDVRAFPGRDLGRLGSSPARRGAGPSSGARRGVILLLLGSREGLNNPILGGTRSVVGSYTLVRRSGYEGLSER